MIGCLDGLITERVFLFMLYFTLFILTCVLFSKYKTRELVVTSVLLGAAHLLAVPLVFTHAYIALALYGVAMMGIGGICFITWLVLLLVGQTDPKKRFQFIYIAVGAGALGFFTLLIGASIMMSIT